MIEARDLKKQFSEKLAADERDLLRADMIRKRLKTVARLNPKSNGGSAPLDKTN